MKLPKLNFVRALSLVLALILVNPSSLEAQHIRQDSSGRLVPEIGGARLGPEDQIKLGRQTAAEVYKQMPVLPGSSPVTCYVQQLGARLAAKSPGYRWPFEFHVIAQKEINAFALPGGPIFINLGTIQTADEGELAGVMAHEISHVVMQHTARDAGKRQTTETLGKLGAILAGAVFGGISGQLAAGAIQVGAGAISMSYSRTDETEADLLGAQIMYDAGYNPYSMAEFFQRLAAQGGGGVQFLSDHPNPGNRAETVRSAISKFPNKSYPRSDSAEFKAMKRAASSLPAYTAQQIAQHRGPWNFPGTGSDPVSASSTSTGSIENVRYEQVRPANTWQQFEQGSLAFEYPANWKVFKHKNGILVAPPAGISAAGAIAYGLTIQSTTARGSATDVSRKIAEDILQSNPGMKRIGGPNRLQVNGVEAIAFDLVGDSPVHEAGRALRERDWLVTLPGRDGSCVVLIFTSPDRDYAEMKNTFQGMLRSLRVQ